MQGFGWSLDTDGVELMYRSPVDVHVDEWVYTLLETVQRTGARRVLIDSLSDLQLASPDPIRFREYMYSLVQRLARSNVSLFRPPSYPTCSRRRISPSRESHTSPTMSSCSEYVREDAALRLGAHRPEDPGQPSRAGDPPLHDHQRGHRARAGRGGGPVASSASGRTNHEERDCRVLQAEADERERVKELVVAEHRRQGVRPLPCVDDCAGRIRESAHTQ